MNVRKRIAALRFLDKQNNDTEYAKKLGVKVELHQPFNPCESKSNLVAQLHYNNQQKKRRNYYEKT